VQQGGELAYLIRHDPEFAGAPRTPMKRPACAPQGRACPPCRILERADGNRAFRGVSAPREVVVSALVASSR